VSPTPSPEDGNRSSFRNVVFFSVFLEYLTIVQISSGIVCAVFMYPILELAQVCPEIGTSSIDWVELSGFYLKTETESSLRNVMF
jgi:hypothetical protein